MCCVLGLFRLVVVWLGYDVGWFVDCFRCFWVVYTPGLSCVGIRWVALRD